MNQTTKTETSIARTEASTIGETQTDAIASTASPTTSLTTSQPASSHHGSAFLIVVGISLLLLLIAAVVTSLMRRRWRERREDRLLLNMSHGYFDDVTMINDVTNNDVMYNDVRLKHEVPSHNRGTDYEKFSDF